MNAGTRIILVRHGQTVWNRGERFRGRSDIPLDEIGLKQSEAIAGKLAPSGAGAVLSSPLRRTMMTAQAIAAALGLSVEPWEDLIDIDYGLWQGLSTAEARARDPLLYQRWLESPHLAAFPGGEGLGDVRDRVVRVIATVLARYANRTVILVTHVVVCRVFVCTVLGLDLSHFWQIAQDPGAISTIGVREGMLVLNSMNDTCHLKGIA